MRDREELLYGGTPYSTRDEDDNNSFTVRLPQKY